MKVVLNNNSVVIIANSHNPSVISKIFFEKSGIDYRQIDEKQLIITPAVTQVIFKDKSSIQLDAQRLTITSLGDNFYSTELAIAYCKTLPFIKGTGLGINFIYDVKDFDFKSWFAKLKSIEYKNSEVFSCDLKFNTSEGTLCVVKVSMNTEKEGSLAFNFHHDLNSTLGEIKLDFATNTKSYLLDSQELIKKLFV